MNFLFCICILLFIVYALLIYRFIRSWDSINIQSDPKPSKLPPLSIIIPARNEESNIENTLNSILNQKYPSHLVEVIVVDDHSNDSTVQIVKNYADKVLLIALNDTIPLAGSKKLALATGIEAAKHDLIVTIDADCTPVSEKWLETMVYVILSGKSNAVTGPIRFQSNSTVWQSFQALDIAGMMIITAVGYKLGWFQMANGANLCFKKQTYNQVNGYAGNDWLASGDDMFLFEKIELAFPGTTSFVNSPEAIVSTDPPNNFKAYLQQRLRWGTKNKYLKNYKLKLVLAFVFLINFSVVVFVLLFFWVSFMLKIAFIMGISIKLIFDYLLLKRGSVFLDQQKVLKRYFLSSILYPVFLTITGILSIFKTSFEWKGRKTR
ncbi:MAG: glycosyltransferase [Saprospiraceae bacterium]|nr:glycosyltransferase [Saprospiraceae bacterium]